MGMEDTNCDHTGVSTVTTCSDERLPESPRWFLHSGMEKEAEEAMIDINGQEEGEEKFNELKQSAEQEADNMCHTGTC
jgi:hypothetical protein